MTTGFVLINCLLGTEAPVIEKIVKASDSIKIARGLYGIHDIIVMIVAEGAEEVRDIVNKIRRIEGVTSTVTHLVIDEHGGKG